MAFPVALDVDYIGNLHVGEPHDEGEDAGDSECIEEIENSQPKATRREPC